MAQQEAEILRPLANFSPSLWGDQFIKNDSDAKVRYIFHYVDYTNLSMLTATGTKMVDTMNLIDTLERLGVSYHFEHEIEEILQQFFNLNTDYNDEAYDLYTVATHFRLFRQHGHRITCADIFGRWRDENGKFHEGLKDDAKGLLSLYEASYLRTRGETILDEALDFTTASLKSIAPNLESPLRRQVEHALVQQLHWGNPRIEARNFISLYEEYEDKDESLLRFAKLDYNLLQMMHKEELHEVSRWWKELDLVAKLPYARDRVVECFFWAMGVYHEPQYSRARVMLTKTIAMTSIIDDTYDAYGTIEELDIFTEAIERWNVEEMKRLPEYIKPFYKALLELYEQFEEELAKEGRSYATHYAIESLKELVRSYHVEAKWFIQGYLPPFEEYLKNALITCTYCYHTTTSLLGVESAVREDFEWLSKKPKMLVAGLLICRVIDDIATYEVEKDRGQIATGIESYMRDNGATKEEAITKFFEIANDAWKDINEECMRPSPHSRDVLMRILNLERIIDVTYKGNEDGYTQPEKVLKPHIIALFVDPIQI
uniref:Germacrene A synthase n=1 Tax=Lavandula viridis TaxID=1343918 RepID=GEAS_LAVVI|nr:RecName: Full=Germacrene A synthase; Short=LvGEAS; AltName: Full=Beta-elemene synthase [Lavandula viridis]AGN72806.1 germacrene A [Lavandula viridis]